MDGYLENSNTGQNFFTTVPDHVDSRTSRDDERWRSKEKWCLKDSSATIAEAKEPGYESRSFLSEELNDRASSNPHLYFPSSLSARKESPPAHWISEKAGSMVLDTVGALEGKNEGGCVEDDHPRHVDSCEDTNAWYGVEALMNQRRMKGSFRVIVTSNNHTLSMLFKRTRAPHIFAPPSNEKYFEWIGTPGEHAHIFDWWDAQRVEIPCTFVDGEGKKVYFAGDPVILGTDLSRTERMRRRAHLIPIGAYEPRWFMCTIQCASQDSVRICKDIMAQKAVAMHCGGDYAVIKEAG
ncbi:hypothetical protein ARMGADRAFT_1084852 [Armillaria gallica]|uniref:Metallo-beta-lactamase domain-containing protein n=1 Tax=Armillaria gallica TaxID=47427 RepID=A0A2H3DIY4_ARMGA|nr:hypothetical protein ARMGADRAFT_1084852 [Armillaria gallica]